MYLRYKVTESPLANLRH